MNDRMTNDGMTKESRMTNAQLNPNATRHSSFVLLSSFVMRSFRFLLRVSVSPWCISINSCLRIALLATLLTTVGGCNAVLALGYLIGGPPSIDPDFNVQTGKALDKKDT